MSEQRIAIAGCTGRMGRMLIEARLKGDGVRLVPPTLEAWRKLRGY